MPDQDPRYRNLTMMETAALQGGLNVSDGHPRMPLTAAQQAIVEQLPLLFQEAMKRPFSSIEHEAHQAFLSGIGQQTAPVGTDRLVSCYSSSVAMDIVARCLRECTSRVALIHPTFDNIPDLLRARGLELLPITEEEFDAGLEELPEDVGAVFVTTPNNPTGWVLSAEKLAALARFCARTGRVLAMDTCFRAQDLRAQYDSYQILEDAGVDWVVIEDSGKLWPMLELKAGFLAWGDRTRLDVENAFSDVLLSISPVILLLITHLAMDAKNGGYAQLRKLIERNRRTLSQAIRDTPLTCVDPDSRISVARLALPQSQPTADEFYLRLREDNVHLLPCAPFHWARKGEGEAYVRIALARSPEEIVHASRAVADAARMFDGRRR